MEAQGNELKLIRSRMSPFPIRVQIALNIKGVAYDTLEEDSAKKSELLLKSNPVYKMIPVLIHNGKPICESMMIVEYIDEVWAHVSPMIMPSDPYERAIARFWAGYVDNKLPASIRILLGLIKGSKEEAYKEILATFQLMEETFKKCSRGEGFFGGEKISYLDIAFGCFLVWLKALEKLEGFVILDESKTPLLVEWANRFCSDDSVKSVMPGADELVDHAKFVRAILNVAPDQ